MSTMEVSRCRLVGITGCAAVTLSKCRSPVHPATAGCSALFANPASAAGCSALLAAPAPAAGCSALLAGAPVCPSKLARSLLLSVMTACCNSVITVANGRRRLWSCCRLWSYCRTFHEEQRGDTSCCRGSGVFLSTETAARSFSTSGVLQAAPCKVNHQSTAAMELNVSAGCSTLLAGTRASPLDFRNRLPVHPATAGCSALLAAPASAAACSALLAVPAKAAGCSALLAAPAQAASCSALLAGAPVWPSKQARSLLLSVMTACCNSVVKVGNGRRRL